MNQSEGPRRFSARRKVEAVLRLFRGNDLDLVSQELDVPAAKLTAWRDAFVEGGKAALKKHAADRRDREIDQLKAMVGELTMRLEALKGADRRHHRRKPDSSRPAGQRKARG